MVSPLDDEQALPAGLTSTPGRFIALDIYEAPDWYDVDYAAYRGEASFYARCMAVVPSGAQVVELGAGTGRLTQSFARGDVDLLAVEPAPAMRTALHACAQAWPRTTVVDGLADTFCVPRPAHLIVFAFNSIRHLLTWPALHSALRHIRACLHPQGAFAFDVSGPYWDALAHGPMAWGQSDERTHHKTGARVLTCDRSTLDDAAGVLHIDIRYRADNEAQGVQIALAQRMWTYQQLLWALHENGMHVDALYGDVTLVPFVAGSSRMLLTARPR